MMSDYRRNIEELQKKAVMWWPEDLKKQTAAQSVIPLLLETQEQFLAVLKISNKQPEQIFDVIAAAKFPANLFLKHLVVLADFGGEQIQRMNSEFDSLFSRSKGSKYYMGYIWRGSHYRYEFQMLPLGVALTNKKMSIDGPSTALNVKMNPLLKDMVMILMYGSSADRSGTADVLAKCELGTLLGLDNEIESYIRQKYIMVSRITRGATANTLGQLAQKYSHDYLEQNLSPEFEVVSNGKVVLANYEKKDGLPFDVVVGKNGKYVGVEISFQVTTNSTIERKSGQASWRRELMTKEGNQIAYIIDGAGNFQRKAAIARICEFSDCTVGYSTAEFDVLIDFIRKTIG